MNHISCLVHGTFNAWCPKQPLIKAMKDPDPLALMGCEIEFTVDKVSSNNGVLSMRGKFKKILKRKYVSHQLVVQSVNPFPHIDAF